MVSDRYMCYYVVGITYWLYPLAYGYPPYYALCPGILTGIIAIFSVFSLKRYIPECNISHYLFAVFARSMAIGIVTWIICNYIHSFFQIHSLLLFLFR